MKLLIIEDDREVADFIATGLIEDGHEVHVASDGRQGLRLASEIAFDILVVDRMLPELDGLTVIQTLRASQNFTPVLILSALGQVDDRVKGLRAGGDDYLVKPFAFSELLARIESLQRRIQPLPIQETKLFCDDLEVDLLTRRVTRGSNSIELLAREYRLLEYMLRHKGQVVTRDMLLQHVWDYNFDPQTNVIDVHISRLRTKLDKTSNKPFIRTVRGTGYIIDVTR